MEAELKELLETMRQETAAQFETMRQETATQFETMRQETATQFETMRRETATQFQTLRHEMTTEFKVVRQEMTTEFKVVRQEMDTRFGRFDAEFAVIRRENALAHEDTRRHFDVAATRLREELGQVSEGVLMNTHRIERLDAKVDRIFADHERRITRLEADRYRAK